MSGERVECAGCADHQTPAFLGMSGDGEALARDMFAGWSGAGWDQAHDYWREEFRERARIVLASDWLAAHDQAVRAEALAPIEATVLSAEVVAESGHDEIRRHYAGVWAKRFRAALRQPAADTTPDMS